MEHHETIRFANRATPAERCGRTAIVVPCYNEAERLPASLLAEAVERHRWLELYLVDDGSRDGTAERLDRLASCHPRRIHVLRLDCNRGKGEAVRQGVLAACASGAEFIGYWDADLATPLDQIPPMRDVLQRLPRVDLVLGSRRPITGRSIRRRRLRRLLGRIFAGATSLVLRLPIYDTQCGAKLFRRTVELERVVAEPFASRWIFDVELLIRWRAMTGPDRAFDETVYEFPLDRWQDVGGSKLRRRDFAVALRDLAHLAWHDRIRPTRGSPSRPATSGSVRRAA